MSVLELAARLQAHVEGQALADDTASLAHEVSREHPVLAGELLEHLADLRRDDDAGRLALYLTSVKLRRAAGQVRSHEVCVAALKAAELARRLGRDEVLVEACQWAVGCESEFPARMARESLALHHVRRGEFHKALSLLGQLEDLFAWDTMFPAGVLLAMGRARQAASLWEDLPEAFRSNELFAKVWALHRAGDAAEARRVLSAALAVKGYFWNESMVSTGATLKALVFGRSTELPAEWHPEFGPVPPPTEHEVRLSVFDGVKSFRAPALAAKLRRLAHAPDVELAKLLLTEASRRRTAGEVHERAPVVPLMREAIALLDAKNGVDDPNTLPHLSALFWETQDWDVATRYLSSSPPADDTAEGIARRLAMHLNVEAGHALATTWLERCLAAGHQAWELAHTVAQLERRRGAHAEEAARLRQALSLFDASLDEGRAFSLRMELVRAARAAGVPDEPLERELDDARAQWAAEAMHGAGVTRKRAVPMLQPYLRPGGHFTDAPFEVMDRVGQTLGWRFLRMRINARPEHGVMIETCRPHAAVTTFSGYVSGEVSIESLETRDTPAIRDAFVPTADDVVPLEGERIYFWWD